MVHTELNHSLSSQDPWLHAPPRPVLESDEAHVWRAYLNQEPSTVRAYFDILDSEEQRRANRFHFMKDREHFIVARGVLRSMLGRYLDTSPQLIHFGYNQYGKPALDNAVGFDELRFNVSHANAVALYAVTLGREVGLDIEFIREDFARMEIAERFFSGQEVAALRALAPAQQTIAFFNCWTRKEAYIKARGEGLSHPLDSFAVSCAPNDAAALLRTENDSEEASRWTVMELAPGKGYVAALVVEGTLHALRLWQWMNM